MNDWIALVAGWTAIAAGAVLFGMLIWCIVGVIRTPVKPTPLIAPQRARFLREAWAELDEIDRATGLIKAPDPVCRFPDSVLASKVDRSDPTFADLEFIEGVREGLGIHPRAYRPGGAVYEIRAFDGTLVRRIHGTSSTGPK